MVIVAAPARRRRPAVPGTPWWRRSAADVGSQVLAGEGGAVGDKIRG